jgi:uncharacterized RDD family membrane protein YckC
MAVDKRPYIGVGRRALALLVDIIVLLPLEIPIGIAFGDLNTGTRVDLSGRTVRGFDYHMGFGGFFLLFLVSIGYFTICEGLWGRTAGKLATGIKVVQEDGRPLDWKAALIRNLLRIVDGFFIYLVAAILVWSTPRRQRLGDTLAHTVVISADASVPQPVGYGAPAWGQQAPGWGAQGAPPAPPPPPPPVPPMPPGTTG